MVLVERKVFFLNNNLKKGIIDFVHNSPIITLEKEAVCGKLPLNEFAP